MKHYTVKLGGLRRLLSDISSLPIIQLQEPGKHVPAVHAPVNFWTDKRFHRTDSQSSDNGWLVLPVSFKN